jgi:hypothetical protein
MWYPSDELRGHDELDVHMATGHRFAETGESVTGPMWTRSGINGCDEVLIKGAPLARIPLDRGNPLVIQTVGGSAET